MGVFEEIKGIRKMLLTSELPDEITAKIIDAVKVEKQKQYGTQYNLQLTLQLTKMGDVFESREVTTSYRIPKAKTGKGQLDMLIAHFKTLKVDMDKALIGQTFKWKRKELEGSMKGKPRHYPIAKVNV